MPPDADGTEALNRSLVLAVRVQSLAPEKAARLAEATAARYLDRQMRAKADAANDATNWLGEQLDELRSAVATAESAAAAYRARHQLGQKGEASAITAQREELVAEVINARASRAEADARLQQLLAVEKIGGLASSSAVLASPLIQRLQEQAAVVERRLADLSARYGAKHPRIKETRAERDGIVENIRLETRKLLQAAREEAAVAQAREKALDGSLADLERQRGSEGSAAVRLAELEREAASSRAVYESFLARHKEAIGQTGLASADAHVISRASVPIRPIWPRPGMALAAAALAGLMLGLGAVFIGDRVDKRLRRPEDVQRHLGRGLLGQVPLVTDGVGLSAGDEIEDELRSIRIGLALAEHPHMPRVLCVTSSLPGEGKTTLSAWLGVTAAARSQVVLVDCDLRRPRLDNVCDMTDGPGLAELLEGRASIGEVIHETSIRNLSLVPARPRGGSAGDLLTAPVMQDLLARLRETYDLVILDTPPVLPVPDARLIAPLADSTLYVVQWEKTPHDVAAEGLARIAEGNAPDPHVILSQVDLRKQASYGYGGYARYYRHYGAYHASVG